MEESQYGAKSTSRRGAWIFGGTFAALLAVLMFFSSTIYRYNLPQVTADQPGNGYLNKKETSSGFADWETVEKIYSPIAGKIAEVYVAEDDWVTAGQPLFSFTFDRVDAERKLRDIENSREKLEYDIQSLNMRIERNKRTINDHIANQAEARRQYEKAAVKVTTNNDLELVDIDIRKAEKTLADTRILYEAGAATQREVTTAEESLESLNLKRRTTIRTYEEQLEKDADNLDSLYRNIESYNKTIADSRADLASLELDLESRTHDRKNYDLQSEPYLDLLADYDANGYVYADTDGIALSVPVEKGQNVNENALMATVGVGISYIIECTISLDNNFVFPGDYCRLSNTSHVFDGYIASITPGERGKAIKIRLESDEASAGESFDITFSRRSDVRYTLVPNGALHQDSDGYYVNQIKKRKGLLGDEYYLDRLDVYIGDSDSESTVLTGNVRFFEPIMLSSDKPVSPGDTITLTNEDDFFAN